MRQIIDRLTYELENRELELRRLKILHNQISYIHKKKLDFNVSCNLTTSRFLEIAFYLPVKKRLGWRKWEFVRSLWVFNFDDVEEDMSFDELKDRCVIERSFPRDLCSNCTNIEFLRILRMCSVRFKDWVDQNIVFSSKLDNTPEGIENYVQEWLERWFPDRKLKIVFGSNE